MTYAFTESVRVVLTNHISLPSLDAVEDLMANSNFCSTFDSMTKRLPDLERMLSRIHAKSIKKKDL